MPSDKFGSIGLSTHNWGTIIETKYSQPFIYVNTHTRFKCKYFDVKHVCIYTESVYGMFVRLRTSKCRAVIRPG